MELNYEQDVLINESALDVEWLNQAELGIKYGKALSRIKSIVERLEEQKKIKRSELILKANTDPVGLIGKAKPNAGDIEAYYRCDKDYKALIEELITHREELAFMEIATNEIRYTRKNALENLVKLHGQSYFAGPNVPRDLEAEVKATKITNLKIAKELRKRGKK